MSGLRWRPGPARDTYRAACGSQMQGDVLVWRGDDGWRWKVDMLPGDSEPAIRSTVGCATSAEAMRMADAQVTLWPTLVRDAAR